MFWATKIKLEITTILKDTRSGLEQCRAVHADGSFALIAAQLLVIERMLGRFERLMEKL